MDRLSVEATAEVARRCRVWDRTCAKGIEERRVIASDLDVIQDSSTTQDVEGDVPDVVRVANMISDFLEAS